MRVLPYFKEKIIICYLANLISQHVEYVKILNRYNPHVILFRLNSKYCRDKLYFHNSLYYYRNIIETQLM